MYITASAFKPTEVHVKSVRFLLLRLLPLELVDLIIEDAEYWACVHSETSEETEVSAWDYPDYKAVWCYLVSPSVPGDSTQSSLQNSDGSLKPRGNVRMVSFDIESHDQGWGGKPHMRGTRNGSWTWFEAAILRESKPDWLRTALSFPVDLRAREADASFDNALAGLQPSMRWHIESNLTAVSQRRSHSVIWTREKVKGAHQVADSLKGREGFGHELVNSLQAGDRVVVLAMAQFPGWTNYVYKGSVNIYCSL